jgi:hypothetical protein
MITAPQIVFNLLWFAHPVLQTAVAVAMYRRKAYKIFPIFFTYILSQILIFAVTFSVYGNYTWFFYLYWIGEAISVFLGFKVIHEVFLDVFRPFHTLRDLGTVLFKWAGLVMLLVAIVVAFSSPSASPLQSPMTQAILTTERCVRVIQCGLVLFLLVFSRYLGISWRQQSFGVALGFGSFASVELAVVALGSGSHISSAAARLVNMASFNCAIGIWVVYFLLKSPLREQTATLLQSQRWEQSLNDIQHPDTGDSLIPLFEGMVDRALSRTPSGIGRRSDVPSEPTRTSFSSAFGVDPANRPSRLPKLKV